MSITRHERLRTFEDFFENAIVGLHIVGPDGIIQWANRAELEFLGYADHPAEYLDHHIAEFHVDQEVINDMLERLLANQPLVHHPARLRHRDGSIRAVTIYSNSRLENGRFINTRCLTYPAATEAEAPLAPRFAWPSSEE
jgi:PAS domain S-box-containing protein